MNSKSFQVNLDAKQFEEENTEWVKRVKTILYGYNLVYTYNAFPWKIYCDQGYHPREAVFDFISEHSEELLD